MLIAKGIITAPSGSFLPQLGAVYNGGMIALKLFRNARTLLLLLVCVACAPASPITLGQRSSARLAMRPDVSHVAYVAEGAQDSLPALAAGETRLYATQAALPTYPIEAYQSVAFDSTYRWPYLRFDRERFQTEAPPTEIRHYELLVLENEYLQVSILPELGGRIWQVVHKPTGDTMFYQNSVVKPSPWGPASQLGWLAVGGLEWALPVNEHGYDWGTTWPVTTFQDEDGSIGVHISTPDDGRLLSAEIVVKLTPDRADFTIAPTLHNHADHALSFHFWQTAMLAPGPDNVLSEDLRFVSPSAIMSIHSTGDTMLPGPGLRFTWPRYFGRDLSRLGNWDRYVGFFEYPRAHGPFVGVYDPLLDAGAVRVFPADVAQGSKVFGLGWRNRIGSEDFTDDGSTYVELHGGLSPTFDEPYTLGGGQTVTWEESWYPVEGIGDMLFANEYGALSLIRSAEGMRVAFYPTSALAGTLIVLQAGKNGDVLPLAEYPLDLAPATPFVHSLEGVVASDAEVTVQVRDAVGALLLEYAPGADSSK